MRRLTTFTLSVVLLIAPAAFAVQQSPGGSPPSPRTRGGRRNAVSPRAIRGQILSDGARRLDHPVRVQLEAGTGQVFDTAFTDGNGNFTFDQLSGGETFYVLVDEPGFKRTRVQVTTGPFSVRSEVIILESVADEDSVEPGAISLGELLAEIPAEARTAFEAAREHSADGDHEEAAERLEEAVRIAPDFYLAQFELGVAYQRLGRNDDAIRHFLIAKELSPNTAAPALSLGVLYLQNEDLQGSEGSPERTRLRIEQAIVHLEDAVERDPRSPVAQYYLGAAHFSAGSFENALERLNRALLLNEQFHDVRIMLFNVYLALGNDPAALEQLTTYLELYPDSPQRDAIEKAKASLQQQLDNP